ncbi:hypothetical protein KI387_026080, partial [Taxus chinensis]
SSSHLSLNLKTILCLSFLTTFAVSRSLNFSFHKFGKAIRFRGFRSKLQTTQTTVRAISHPHILT